MATKAKRHTHKYHKVNLTFGQVWACGLPNCNHHMPNHMTELVAGKASYCWQCENPIVLDASNMAEDKPRCSKCRTGIDPDAIEAIVGSLT